MKKKIILVGFILAVLCVSLPAFAGGHVVLNSKAFVASGNIGPGGSYEKAWNVSHAGFDASKTTTCWTIHLGPFHISHKTIDVDATTYANTQGGTFGNGIGFQSGFALSSFSN